MSINDLKGFNLFHHKKRIFNTATGIRIKYDVTHQLTQFDLGDKKIRSVDIIPKMMEMNAI